MKLHHMLSRGLVTLAAALLLSVGVARAGFDVEIPFEGAYNYLGTCTSTGTHALRTVPNCKGTGDGSFDVRYFTRVTGAVEVFTVDVIRFVLRSAPGATVKNVCFNVSCTATTTGGTEVATYAATGGLSNYDVGTGQGGTCASGNECQWTAGGTPVAVKDMNTGSACASTTCNNTEMICRVSVYGGSGTGTCATPYAGANGIDVSSMKLTVGP